MIMDGNSNEDYDNCDNGTDVNYLYYNHNGVLRLITIAIFW